MELAVVITLLIFAGWGWLTYIDRNEIWYEFKSAANFVIAVGIVALVWIAFGLMI